MSRLGFWTQAYQFDFGNSLFLNKLEKQYLVDFILLFRAQVCILAMHQEKYSLTWHTYSDHLKSMMKELMMNEDYSDVTLVTEDKRRIKANVNILSACSPVFKDILKKEKNSNTVMYLRGVQ